MIYNQQSLIHLEIFYLSSVHVFQVIKARVSCYHVNELRKWLWFTTGHYTGSFDVPFVYTLCVATIIDFANAIYTLTLVNSIHNCKLH